MSIEVIERGTPPGEKPYKVTCTSCRSKLKFLRTDAKFTSDQRDGAYLTIRCPVCGTDVHTAC